MEDLIAISNLNDFIFCPVSIYFHLLYGNAERLTYQSKYQIDGAKAHETIDDQRYSTRKDIIASLDVYSQEYGLVGKIDLYDGAKSMLIERKKHVVKIYDGYVFQLYAQYYGMTEMGYKVNRLRIHSMDDNKNYDIPLPETGYKMKSRFEKLIKEMRSFDLTGYIQTNSKKCGACIYVDACDRTLYKEESTC